MPVRMWPPIRIAELLTMWWLTPWLWVNHS